MTDEQSPPKLAAALNRASMTEVVPFASHKIHLFRNKFFIPALIIALTAVLFLELPLSADLALWLLADYFMFTLFLVIYFYSEIDRPLSLYAIPALIMYAIMQLRMWYYPVPCGGKGPCVPEVTLWYGIYYAFDFMWRDVWMPVVGKGNSVWQNILAMIAQPGLREEFVKAIPALIGAGLTLAEAPAIYALGILLPPAGLFANGQNKAGIINICLLVIFLVVANATGFFPFLLAVPLHAVIMIALHRRSGLKDAKPSKLHELLRVRGPLDGVMLGVASGLTFTLLENMYQYIPQQAVDVKKAGGSFDAQLLQQFLLLIPRSLDSIIAHFAWAGISGYFIGLLVLRPKGWPILLALAWLVPGALHGIFDGLLTSNLEWWVLPFDLLSFVFFLACLLKARQLHMSLFETSDVAARA